METTNQKEIDGQIAEGYSQVEGDEHETLLIEHRVDSVGTASDVEKRNRLEELMSETFIRTCCGACDGGRIDSGSIDVFCYVVDLVKKIIESLLGCTEFPDCTHIFNENESPGGG